MNISNITRIICILPIMFLFGGCAHYTSMESRYNRDEIPVELISGPDKVQVISRASSIEHPLLSPVTIDFADGISPDEAAIIAVIANPSLSTERDNKKIAAAQVIQAGLLPNPQLSLSYEIPTGGDTQGVFNAYGLGLDWEVTALITREARLSSASFNQKAVDMEVAWKEWQISEAARLHWFTLYWDLEKRKLLEEWSNALATQVEVLEKAVEQGTETAPSLASAKTAFFDVKAQLSKNLEQIQQERAALKLVMGVPPNYHLVIQKLDFQVPLSAVLMKNINIATGTFMKRRLDIMALRAACSSRDEQVREAVLSQFPKIGIGLIHSKDNGDVISTGPSVTLEIPLFDRRQGQLAAARAARIRAIDEYHARIFEAVSRVAEIKERIRCMSAQYSRVSEAASAHSDMLQIYRQALSQGTADVLTYYQALGTMLQRKIDLLDIKSRITELLVALETATGTHFPLTEEISHEKDNEKPVLKRDNFKKHEK